MTLTNTTWKAVNVSKMHMLESHFDVRSGARPILNTNDPTVAVEFQGDLLAFALVQFGFSPPEAFTVIPARKSYAEVLILPPTRNPLTVGSYSLFLVYAGRDFGAKVIDESGNYFLDFNAWMGEIRSNTVTFEVVQLDFCTLPRK